MSQGPGRRPRSAGPNRSGAAGRTRGTRRPRSGDGARPGSSRPAGAAPRPRQVTVAGEQSEHRRRGSGLLRQAAILTAVLVAVAALVAVPLRNYLDQQDLLAAEKAKESALREQLVELEDQRDALGDPDYIRAAARDRLQYVNPGDTPYVIDAPEPVIEPGQGHVQPEAEQPWFDTLWETVSEPVSAPVVEPTP